MPVASELLIKIGADTREAESGISRVDKQVSGFAKSAGALGAVATGAFLAVGAAAVGLGAGFVSAVGSASEFQSVVSQVGAVSGATAPQLQMLSDLALQMGADTAFSASEAAQAMAELAKGGIAVGDMAKVLPGTLDLAAAGGIGLAEAATIATDAMAIFGKQGVTMDRVANAFAGAANISSIGVNDMAEAMKYVGPVAASFGISLEDASAAIALLGANGLKGSQAGTGLRTVLTSLAAPTDKAANLIKDLGLQFFDSSGKMKDMTGISDELQRALGGMSDAQRAATLQTLFGVEGMNAAIALMGTGENSIESYTQKLREAATAHATGVAMMDNFAGSMDALKGSIETASITIGLMLLPYLRDLVDWATRAVNAAVPMIKAWGPKLIAGIKSGVGQAIAVVRDFGGAIVATVNALRTGDFSNLFGPIITAVQTAFGSETAGRVTLFVSGLVRNLNLARDAVITARQAFAGDWVSADSIATPVRLVGEAFTFLGETVRMIQGVIAQIPQPVLAAAAAFIALGPAVRIVAVALPLLIGAFTGLGPIISILTSTLPVLGTVIAALGGPLTLAIVAVGALGVAWATNWLGIRDQTMPIINEIVAFVTGTLLPGLQQLGTYISTVLLPQFLSAWAQIQASIQQAAAIVIPALQQMGAATMAAFEAALPGIQAFVAGMQQMGAAVAPIVQALGSEIVASLGPAMAALGAWAAEVIPQFSAAWVSVMGVVGPIVGELASLIGAGLGTIAGFIEAHGAQITAVLTTAWTVISNLIGSQLTMITGLISAALLLISGDWQGAWDRLVQAVNTSSAQIGTAVAALGQLMFAAMQAAMASFVAAVQQGMASAGAAVQAGVAALPGIAMSIAGAMFGAGVALISNFASGIASKIGDAIKIVQDGVQQIRDLLPGSEPKDASSPLRGLGEAGAAIFGNMADGMSEGQREAVAKAAQVASSIAKAVTDTLGAMKALADFDFAGDSPTGSDMGWFGFLTSSLIATMQEASAGFSDKALESVNKFSETVGKVGASVKSAVDGLLALGKADWANSSPDGNAMAWFTLLISSLIENFRQASLSFDEEGFAAATAYAETAQKVTGVIKTATDGLQALRTFAAPAEEAVSRFLASLGDLMEKFGTWAGGFEADGLAASETYAAAVGKVTGVLDNGTKGLMALADFVAPAESAVSTFLASLSDLMERFGTWAGGFEADGLAASSQFADAAQKVTGSLANGVTGLAALRDFAAPAEAGVSAFLAALSDLMEKFGTWAAGFEQDALEQTTRFADAAGKALSAAKTGVDLFKTFDKLAPPSKEAIDNLIIAIDYVVKQFGVMASRMETEGLKQLSAFADAAGKSLSAVKTGTDLFKQMDKLAVPGKEAIDYLLGTIGYIITQTQAIANGIGEAGMQQAVAFANGAATFIASLKATLEGFKSLLDYKDLPAQILTELWNGLEGALSAMGDLVSRSDALKNSALDYLANMEATALAVLKAQSLGNGLGAAPTIPGGWGGGVVPALASGGVVTKPTFALIGEREPEAVIPLSRYNQQGRGGGAVQIVFNGPVYGSSDFDQRVHEAKVMLERRGVWR